MIPRALSTLAPAALALSVVCVAPATAGIPDLASTDGIVRTSAVLGNTMYLGGTFEHVTRTRGAAVRLDPVTGESDAAFPRVRGIVHAVIPDGAGGFYLGGNFIEIGGVSRTHLAHVLPDGSVGAFAPVLNGPVHVLAMADGVLYAGGEFTTVGGQGRLRLAAFNVPAETLRAWNPEANGTVLALAPSGTLVYVGGEFTQIGGGFRSALAALRTTNGSATTWAPLLSGSSVINVQAIVVDGSTIYFGGSFVTVNGVGRGNAAAVLADGTLTAWTPTAAGSVNAILRSGPTIYLGGAFKFAGGQARNNFAAFDAATGTLTGWNPDAGPSFANNVHALASAAGGIVAAGEFTALGGTPRLRIAMLDPTTGTPTAWDPRLDGPGYALAVTAGEIVCGGDFIGDHHVARRNLCAIDLTSGEPTAWNPSANKTVYALAVAGDTIFAGGTFDTLGSVRRIGLAMIDAGGGVVGPSIQITGSVYALAVEPSRVLLGGYFNPIFLGGPGPNLAAVDRGSGSVPAWPAAKPNFAVWALASDGAVAYAGGEFSQVAGVPRARIAALDAAGGNLLPWNPALALVDAPPDGFFLVQTIALAPGRVYAGGAFDRAGGQIRRHAVALDAATAAPLDWNPDPSFFVYSMLVDGDRVYLGGQFLTAGGAPRLRLTSIEPDSGNASPWTADVEGPASTVVLTMSRHESFLYAGGTMDRMAGRIGRSLGVTDADLPFVGVPGPPDLAALAAPRIFLPAPHPVRFASRLRYEIPRAGTVQMDIIDLRGRRVRRVLDGEWRDAGVHETTLGRDGLAPGIYFLEIRAGGSTARGRFAVLPG